MAEDLVRVSVRFFGSLVESHGERRAVELTPPATVKDLLKALGLSEGGISVAVVNGVQVTLNEELADGASVMLVPPVIGG
ncbi:MAG: MoaD/ThiS family protein [Firmicutes bacterium]|jgi:molybdopterin converting factor small subunit|nr:MoaD/ThiS family protein [Bacillota bacterium]